MILFSGEKIEDGSVLCCERIRNRPMFYIRQYPMHDRDLCFTQYKPGLLDYAFTVQPVIVKKLLMVFSRLSEYVVYRHCL